MRDHWICCRACWCILLGEYSSVVSETKTKVLRSHFYATPFARQAYRLASLAVNLALELGINERPSTTTQHQMIVQCPAMPQETSEALSGDMWSHDVRRAYVGAYTVSTFSSLLFRKPSPLTYTKYLHECAESLASDPQHQSDTMLVHRVQHLRIAEEVTRVFDHGSQEKLKEMDDSKIHVLLKALVRQLTDWQSSLPPSAIHDGTYPCPSYLLGRFADAM